LCQTSHPGLGGQQHLYGDALLQRRRQAHHNQHGKIRSITTLSLRTMTNHCEAYINQLQHTHRWRRPFQIESAHWRRTGWAETGGKRGRGQSSSRVRLPVPSLACLQSKNCDGIASSLGETLATHTQTAPSRDRRPIQHSPRPSSARPKFRCDQTHTPNGEATQVESVNDSVEVRDDARGTDASVTLRGPSATDQSEGVTGVDIGVRPVVSNNKQRDTGPAAVHPQAPGGRHSASASRGA
jgi:hypothetical protein